MKNILIVLLFISFCDLYSQENIENYLLTLRNILNYDTPGYQDITLENTLTHKIPFSINSFPRSGSAIRPYDVFIECYDKNTNEKYYTRSLFLYLNDGYIHFNQDFILVTTAFPEANSVILSTMNDTPDAFFYVHLLQILFSIGQEHNEKIISNFALSFYKPTGQIIKNIDNVFFQFETVEETQGYFLHGIIDLSNIDLRAEIINLYSYVNTIDLEMERIKYIEKLDFLLNILDNNLNILTDMPHLLRVIITQFFSMEIINNLR